MIFIFRYIIIERTKSGKMAVCGVSGKTRSFGLGYVATVSRFKADFLRE